MAVFSAGSVGAIDLTTFDIVDFTNVTTHFVATSSPSVYRLADPLNSGTYNELRGTGFIYDGDNLIGGTVDAIDVFDNGVRVYGITGLTFDAALLPNFITTGDSQGFLAALFVGADVLNGSALADQLLGFAGGDTLDGGAGADTLDGGEGSDNYIVDNAKDVIDDSGADTDIDTVFSSVTYALDKNDSTENLTLTGTAAINGTGNSNDNLLLGNGKANILDGGIGNDTMDGGAGADTYVVDSQDDKVAEAVKGSAAEKDLVVTTVSFTLTDNIENLTFIGGEGTATGNGLANLMKGNVGDDELIGLAANDTLEGGIGDDTLDGGTGIDRMVGGLGDDHFFVDSAGDTVVEGDGQGTDTVHSTITYVLGGNLNNLELLGTAHINGTGNGGNNFITGNAGNNILTGSFGADTFSGGKGDDIFIVDFNKEIVFEVEGVEGGHDVVKSSFSFDLSKNGLFVEDLVLGSDFHAVEGIGNAENNKITGNQFNNRIDGRSGDDTMAGGGGDDIFFIDSLGDKVSDSSGLNDEVVSSVAFGAAILNIEHYTFNTADPLNFTGTTAANRITGGTGNDSLAGGAGNDTLNGGAGTDTLEGGIGKDTYVIDNVGDIIIETGNDVGDTVISNADLDLNDPRFLNIENGGLSGIANLNIIGTAANNILTGNDNDSVPADKGGKPDTTGNNELDGGAGNDTIFGLGGKDTLDGGTGADSMVGGKGDDLYIVDNIGDKISELSGADEGRDTVQSSLSYILGANLNNLTLVGDALTGTGNELGNVIRGNDKDNVLDGKFGNDILLGGKGDDIYIVDSSGDSTALRDSKGIVLETELAGGGHDIVKASQSFVLDAEIEELILTGTLSIDGTGNDIANLILGNSGNNRLDGGLGADTMNGGAGNDSYTIDNAGDQFIDSGGLNDELVVAFNGFEIKLYAGFESYDFSKYTKEAVVFAGDKASNRIIGTDKFGDIITDDIGNDTLDGGGGADTLAAGVGNDRYVIDNVGDKLTELAGGGTDTIESRLVSFSMSGPEYANFENLTIGAPEDNPLLPRDGTGNKLANVITGNNAANKMEGLDGNDTIIGDSGDDTLDGGIGSDSMNGGFGSDVYLVDTLSDRIAESFGKGESDTVITHLTYTLGLFVEDLVLIGDGKVNGTGNILENDITGNKQDNVLSGGDKNDTLRGGDGNDTLIGGFVGADSMVGGAGDDLYYVESFADKIEEKAGEGYDTVIANPFRGGVSNLFTLDANIEKFVLNGAAGYHVIANGSDNLVVGGGGADSVMGGEGHDTLQGNGGNDTLVGGPGGDRLEGGAGIDLMTGGDGDDVYVIDNVKDIVQEFGGGGGIDTLESSIAIDAANYKFIDVFVLTGGGALTAIGDGNANSFVGNDGANKLTGNGGADTLAGGKGNDTLDGGDGDDTLTGGAGNDSLLGALGTDTAVFSGNSAGYTVTTVAGVTTVVDINKADGDDGTDKFSGVELLKFADKTISLSTDPVIISNGGGDKAAVTVAENGTAVTAVVAVGLEPFTYTIVGGVDMGDFAIDPGTGALSFKDAPDFEAPADLGGNNVYDIVVQATDKNGVFDTQAITVTVSDLNEAPAISSGTAFDLEENKTLAATITAIDPENDKLVFSIVGGDDKGDFVIDSATGKLSFKVAPDFDNPTDTGGDNVYSVIVQVSDGKLTDSQAIEVTVTDVDEGPGAVSDKNAAANGIAENAVNGALVGITAQATDPDGDPVTYSLTDDAGGLFAIDALTGVVTVVDGSQIDFEDDKSHDITVEATSSGGSSTKDFTIVVADVDEGPGAITDKNLAVNGIAENAASGALVGITAAAVDPDGDPVTYSLTNNAGGRFAIDSGTGVVTVADGLLLDFEAAASHDITVQAGSSGGTSTQNFTIVLNDVNPENVTGDGAANAFIGGSGDDTFNGGGGNDTITGGTGDDLVRYTGSLDGHDLITDFDGDATGGQDLLDLDLLFDALGGATPRADRVNIITGAGSVDVQVDTDDDIFNGFELTVATLATSDTITVGVDVLVGS